MMKKFKNWFQKFARFKNPGVVVLIPTIILSGLILVVSLGLSQVLITELEFSADLLFSEKAYFAAESGVENSLLALKGKPLNWVIEKEKKVGKGATYDLDIANSVERFPFELAKNEAIKFRLGVDSDENFAGYSTALVRRFEVNILEGNKANLQWKILCPKENKTIALYGWGNNFSQGNYDAGEIISSKSQSDFLDEATEICFMSLSFPERIAGNTARKFAQFEVAPDAEVISGVVSADQIAPEKVKITATGKSFSREKIVSFEYRQKNLSSKFDLGLYFTGE